MPSAALIPRLCCVAALATAGQPPSRQSEPVDRLSRMGPVERKQALQGLPQPRQQAVENRLDRYSQLSPSERDELNRRYQTFQALSPEKQAAARKLFAQYAALKEDRRVRVRAEWDVLRGLNAGERQRRLTSATVRKQFNSRERSVLKGLANLPAPQSN